MAPISDQKAIQSRSGLKYPYAGMFPITAPAIA